MKRVSVETRGASATAGKPRVFISVPKKVVRLATQRNRVKRLLREAIRLDGRFLREGQVYHFRVAKPLQEDGLEAVRRSVRQLADTIFKD